MKNCIAPCRKIRRIMEKRVAQNFRNIFGEVPKGFRYAA